jgi:hypothetical protein
MSTFFIAIKAGSRQQNVKLFLREPLGSRIQLIQGKSIGSNFHCFGRAQARYPNADAPQGIVSGSFTASGGNLPDFPLCEILHLRRILQIESGRRQAPERPTVGSDKGTIKLPYKRR